MRPGSSDRPRQVMHLVKGKATPVGDPIYLPRDAKLYRWITEAPPGTPPWSCGWRPRHEGVKVTESEGGGAFRRGGVPVITEHLFRHRPLGIQPLS